MTQRTETPAEQKAIEMVEMWEAREGDYEFRDYLRSTYRGEDLPEELYRHLRNDGVADWYETCVLRD